MSEVRFQYKTGLVTGGYSFSLHSNVIILPEYIKRLANDRIRAALLYEAERCRKHYVTEVNRLKALGERVNTFLIKREATNKAKAETKAKFSDVWDEVERTYEASINPTAPPHPSSATPHADNAGRDPAPCNPNSEIKFTVTVKAPENLIVNVTEV